MNPAMLHLQRANEVYSEGAKYRREIAALPRSEAAERAAHLLLDPPDAIQRMTARRFVTSIPLIGAGKAPKILARAGIYNTDRQIGPDHHVRRRALSQRQRQALASVLLWRAEKGRS